MPAESPQRTEIRSEEVNEIISHIPNWIIRWGITLLFSIFTAILFISWFIQYPDIITAKVTITTEPTPTTLVARSSGKLVVLKNEAEVVDQGDLVAYIENSATVEDILWLENAANDNLSNVTSQNRKLGDIQTHYSAYLNARSNTDLFIKNKSYERQIYQLKKQERIYQKGIAVANDQLKLSKQELQLSKEQFKTDSLLHIQKVIADLDFNKSRSNWLQKQRLAKNEEATLLYDELQLNNTQKEILGLELQHVTELTNLESVLHNTKSELLAAIRKWKESNLFIVTSPGKIAYLGFFENENFVEAGRPILSVIPQEGKIIAKAEMPVTGSGKVREGQRVNIRLANYPFEQFGIITGKLKTISLVPNNEYYYVEIDLPDGLVTNMNKTLEFKQNLTGTTEVITEDLRLLERFFYQLRGLVYN